MHASNAFNNILALSLCLPFSLHLHLESKLYFSSVQYIHFFMVIPGAQRSDCATNLTLIILTVTIQCFNFKKVVKRICAIPYITAYVRRALVLHGRVLISTEEER